MSPVEATEAGAEIRIGNDDPVLLALLGATDLHQSSLVQCLSDTDLQKRLDVAFSAARKELAAARAADAAAIAQAVHAGTKLPPDASVGAERTHQRLSFALREHVEQIIPKNLSGYYDVLAKLLDARGDLVDEVVRRRNEYRAALSAPLIQFERSTAVTVEKGTITEILIALAIEQHEFARQIRAGQRYQLGDIPGDGKFRRTLGL